MRDKILDFPKQFDYEPIIENAGNLKPAKNFIVVGMGGSHLAADLIKDHVKGLDMVIHKDYGLPDLSDDFIKNSLIVLHSYSGNTEEVIDAFMEAKERGLNMAAISIGGKLLKLAKENNVPFIQMPDHNLEPRMASGYNIKSLLKIIKLDSESNAMTALAKDLEPAQLEEEGMELGQALIGRIPVIYTSNKNSAVGYNWKIKFNENAKIPAFTNVFPELNHNEMTGFDVHDSTKGFFENFTFIVLFDESDDERIKNRIHIMADLYGQRELEIFMVPLVGDNHWHKVFSSLILADWTSYYLVLEYGVEPEKVEMVEEFKELIK